MKKIVLTYGDVRSPIFVGVCQRMISAQLPFPVTIKMLSLAKLINQERDLANELVDKLLREHGDEEKDQRGHYKIREAELAEFNKKMSELNETTFETRLDRIDPLMFTKLELSVNELLAIAPLIIGGEEMDSLTGPGNKKEEAAPEAPAPEASH